MLNIYFNPYPDKIKSKESAKNCLLATAVTCKKIANETALSANSGEKYDSIKTFILAVDEYGSLLSPPNLINEYSRREKDLVIWFLRLFDKGSLLRTEDLSICDDWILNSLDLAAPILEYAARHDGMAITITDDADWKLDFYSFLDKENKLPNIYGQTDCSSLIAWLKEWYSRHNDFKSLLEKKFNLQLCRGSSNRCFPSKDEESGIITALERAQENDYQIDNNLIKPFQTESGNILELRSYGDGMRVFFTLSSGKPIIGGFYRKSSAISQNKAAKNAGKRLKEQRHI